MLVSDIVRRVRTAAGDTAVLQFTQTTITDWINDAIRECVIENSLLQARATSSTVVGQSDYSLPSSIFKIHSVHLDGFKLEMLTLEQFEERNSSSSGADTDVSGSPFLCYIYAGSLTVWPTPNTVQELKINYTKMPDAITYSEGPPEVWNPSSPTINEAFHNRIVSYCLAQVALQDEDHYKYNMLMTEFKTGISALKDIKDSEEDLYPSISVSSRDMGEAWFYDHNLF